MIIIHKYSNNTFILKDQFHNINLELFNKVLNQSLKNRNELDANDIVNRAVRKDNFIIICGYGGLVGNLLEKYICSFLKISKINYIIQNLTDVEIEPIKDILPIISLRKSDQCGGINNDAKTIDPNIEPLSDALNLYSGVKTFSSCEGHIKNNSGTIYVLFTIDTMEHLDILTFDLYNALEETSKKYMKLPTFKLTFDYGLWPNIKSTYFEMRLIYRDYEQQEIFLLTKYLSEQLLKLKGYND